MKMTLPPYVRAVLSRLEGGGFEAYTVGGAVRDALRGVAVHDYDITTSATPEEMLALFAGEKTVTDGLKHGTLTVIADGHPVEVTTFRVDGDYPDARHPAAVTFTRSLSEDLARRDFTVNAMAYSEKVGLVDLYGGEADLRARIIRAVGEPEKRFSEDALRILRGFRFSSRLGFAIEEKTLAGMIAGRDGLVKISAERIAAEWRGILIGDFAENALAGMRGAGILPFVAPEIGDAAGICDLPAVFELRFAYLLRGAEAKAARRLSALRLSSESQAHILRLLSLFGRDLTRSDEPFVRRLLSEAGELFPELVAYAGVSGVDADVLEKAAGEILRRGDCLGLSSLAVGGRDLLALGYRGKEIGEALACLLDRVLDDPALNTREILLGLLEGKV